MASTNPKVEGASSVFETVSGSSIAIVLVYLLRDTRWAMDMETAIAFVAIAGAVSSFSLAWLRAHLGNWLTRATDQAVDISHDSGSSADASK